MDLDTPTYWKLMASDGMVEPFIKLDEMGVMVGHIIMSEIYHKIEN